MGYGYKIYFTERPKNRVICWDPDSGRTDVVAGEPLDGNEAQKLSDPYGLILDREGRLIMADKRNHRICRLENQQLVPIKFTDENGHRLPIPGVRTLRPHSRIDSPTGLFSERTGGFLCTFSDDNTLYRIHFDGRLELLLGIPPNRPYAIEKIQEYVTPNKLKDLPLWGPTAVVEKDDGTVFFIERGYQALRQYHQNTGLRCVFPFGKWEQFRFVNKAPFEGALSDYHPAYPSALAFDSKGKLYMSDVGHKCILAIDLVQQSFCSVLQEEDLTKPGGFAGFAFGPDGTAWVLDSGTGSLQAYSTLKTPWKALGKPLCEIDGKRLEFFPAGAGVTCG